QPIADHVGGRLMTIHREGAGRWPIAPPPLAGRPAPRPPLARSAACRWAAAVVRRPASGIVRQLACAADRSFREARLVGPKARTESDDVVRPALELLPLLRRQAKHVA